MLIPESKVHTLSDKNGDVICGQPFLKRQGSLAGTCPILDHGWPWLNLQNLEADQDNIANVEVQLSTRYTGSKNVWCEWFLAGN